MEQKAFLAMFINKTGNLFCLFMTTSTALHKYRNLKTGLCEKTLKRLKVSDYKFFYNESLPDLEKIVSLQVTNAIDEAMKFLLSGTSIEYRKGEEEHYRVSRKECVGRAAKSPAQGTKEAG